MKEYDVVIIGSGIAGMTAGIYLKRNNINCLIIENDAPGGQLNRSNTIENYPGYVNIDGPSLAYNIYNQVTKLGVEYLFDDINSIDYSNNIIKTNDKEIKYKYLIIATGRSPKKLEILNKYEGNGVSYCAICDGGLYKNKDVLVIGGGNSAFEEALYLSNICDKVYIMNRSNNLRADNHEIDKVKNKNNIKLLLNEEVNNIKEKDDKFLINNKYLVDGIFVCIGYVPNSSLFDLEKENNYIIVDNKYKTNIDNVYAIGDIIKKDVYQLTTASSEATIASIDIIRKLNN